MKIKKGLSRFLVIAFVLGLIPGTPITPIAFAAEEGTPNENIKPFILNDAGLVDREDVEGEPPYDYYWEGYSLYIESEKEITVTQNLAFDAATADSCPRIIIFDSPDVKIEGINFLNSTTPVLSAIYSTVTVKNCEFKGDATTEDGAAFIAIFDSTATIENTSFTAINTDDSTKYDAIFANGATLTIENVTSNASLFFHDGENILNVLGTNSFSIEKSGVAALQIENQAQLIIIGGGTLNLEATDAAAINGNSTEPPNGSGSNSFSMGELIITDARVNAVSKKYGDVLSAGIGGKANFQDDEMHIGIIGGTIDATSKSFANIGFIGLDGENHHLTTSSIIIMGGSVKANGFVYPINPDFFSSDNNDLYLPSTEETPSFAGKLSHQPWGEFTRVAPDGSRGIDGPLPLFLIVLDGFNAGAKVESLTLAEGVTDPDGYLIIKAIEDDIIKNVEYGIAGMYTDSEGKLYIWLPEGFTKEHCTVTTSGGTPIGGSTGGGSDNSYKVPSIGGATNGEGTTLNVTASFSKSTGEVSVSLADKTTQELIDYAFETAAAAAENGENATPIVTLSLSGVKGAKKASIPANALALLAESGVSLAVNLPTGGLVISPETLLELAEDIGNNERLRVEITEAQNSDMTSAQRDILSGELSRMAAYNIDVYLGNRKVNIPAMATLNYTLGTNENAADIAVWFLNSLGYIENMDGEYSKSAGDISFMVNHQSIYLVGAERDLPFTDVSANDWFYDSVKFVYENGLMDGVSGDKFGPNMPTTRAMMVMVLWNAEGKPSTNKTAPFSDTLDAWYTDAIDWAAEHDIARGYGDGTFGPNDTVTREQMAAILQRYCEFKGIETDETGALDKFADGDTVSAWAVNNMRWAVGSGMITGRGNNTLAPRSSAERAEMATVLERFFSYIAE